MRMSQKTMQKQLIQQYIKYPKKLKKIAHNLRIDDRVEDQSSKPAFVTIKDHKENFPNNINCRLINPAKTNIGKISKQLLEQLNTDIRNATDLQQWRSTEDALQWYNNLDTSKDLTFYNLIL